MSSKKKENRSHTILCESKISYGTLNEIRIYLKQLLKTLSFLSDAVKRLMIMIKAITETLKEIVWREIWSKYEKRGTKILKEKVISKESFERRSCSHFLPLFADHDHWIICPFVSLLLSCLRWWSISGWLPSLNASLCLLDSFCVLGYLFWQRLLKRTNNLRGDDEPVKETFPWHESRERRLIKGRHRWRGNMSNNGSVRTGSSSSVVSQHHRRRNQWRQENE